VVVVVPTTIKADIVWVARKAPLPLGLVPGAAAWLAAVTAGAASRAELRIVGRSDRDCGHAIIIIQSPFLR
jgi:hypothetical protein